MLSVIASLSAAIDCTSVCALATKAKAVNQMCSQKMKGKLGMVKE